MNLDDVDSLSEHIARRIGEQIIVGELVEGERIQELRIAKELDVSRGSVREALLLLERTHLIDIFPRRGAIVSEMSSQQVKALFDSSVLVLGHIVQRLSESGADMKQSNYNICLCSLKSKLKQVTPKNFTMAFSTIWLSARYRGKSLFNEIL